jgi:hypothetical protein
MPKITPDERWRRHVLERYTAFEMSGELIALRNEGLKILGRTSLYTGDEWFQDRQKRDTSSEYSKWCEKCEMVGARFGIAPWTVQMACLIKGYSPDNNLFMVESNWPRIRVVTENTNELFLSWLCYEARNLGLYVIQKHGSSETTMIVIDLAPPLEPLTDSSRPPRDAAFHMRVETPAEYPPEAASDLQRAASNLGRELSRRLGYQSPRRLRSSELITTAKQLKADKSKLTEAESIEVVDNLYPNHEESEERKLLKRCRSQKNQVRQRIVKPYQHKIKPKNSPA